MEVRDGKRPHAAHPHLARLFQHQLHPLRLGDGARRAVARLHGERIGAVEDDQRLGVAALDLSRKIWRDHDTSLDPPLADGLEYLLLALHVHLHIEIPRDFQHLDKGPAPGVLAHIGDGRGDVIHRQRHGVGKEKHLDERQSQDHYQRAPVS